MIGGSCTGDIELPGSGATPRLRESGEPGVSAGLLALGVRAALRDPRLRALGLSAVLREGARIALT